MKTKWFWLPLMAVFFGIMCSGCGDDNDPTEEPGGGDNTEVKGDCIATAEVKTVTLPDTYGIDDYVVYESFNYKHRLIHGSGKLRLYVYLRKEGEWKLSYSNLGDSYWGYLAWVEDVGKVNGLSDITEKFPLEEGVHYTHYFPDVQPNHGYAITFIKEGGEVGYLRVYVKSYTLENDGSLETVTVQYQLY